MKVCEATLAPSKTRPKINIEAKETEDEEVEEDEDEEKKEANEEKEAKQGTEEAP